MSQTTQPVQLTPAPKQKRKRSPSVAKAVYIVMQVLGEDGKPMQFNKKRLKVLMVDRSLEKAAELIEDSETNGSFFMRITVPGGTRAGSPNLPRDAAA